MKTYKATYGISAFTGLVWMCLAGFPASIAIGLLLAVEEGVAFWLCPVAMLGGVLVYGVLCLILVGLINLVAKAVTSNQVRLEENEIYYQGKLLVLDQLQYITVYLPVVQRYARSTPLLLSLWVSDKEKLLIVRPSLLLIATLRKRCPKAKFDIDHSESDFKMCFFIGLGVSVAILLIMLFVKLG